MVPLQVGNVADDALTRTTRRRELVAPRPSDDSLLESIRRALVPGDPVARLLADWPAPPATAVEVVRRPGLPQAS